MAEPARAWQRMLSGRRLDLLDPSPVDIELSDIAHGLARVARWNGQTHGPDAFSVAQHSVLVAQIVRRLGDHASARDQLYALLHDAPEYVIGDMISPFKSVIGQAYRAVEQRLQEAIHLRFSLSAQPTRTLSRAIKRSDRLSARAEAVALAGFTQEEADSLFGGDPDGIVNDLDFTPWPVFEAQARFVQAVEAAEAGLR